jgi:SNF2 family DNA or RNA helicase
MNNQNESIRDNYSKGKVADFLNQNIEPDAELSIVSAFFTMQAYIRLKDKLDKIKSLRFLFGEPNFLKVDDQKEKKSFRIEQDKLVLSNALEQKANANACYDWIKEKVEIKSMVKPDFLHGKLYHIQNTNGKQPEAIVGSSNFTVNGLGLGKKPNIELNMIVQDRRDLKELKNWFDEIWNSQNPEVNVEDVKDKVLEYLQRLYADNNPEFIYYKTLFHIFENFLDEQKRGGLLNEKIGFFDTEIWQKLYNFQKDGVRGAINKILRHNGCIIADSVGLGKTFEALAVIKYFELLNYRVLVLCPKKLSANWTIYQASQNNTLNPFIKDRFNYTVLYHTDLGRKTGKSLANSVDLENFNWGAYDLVVIDESHNFRGNPMDKKKADNSIQMNRAKWLMEEIIKSGTKTKVLLLSATPVNNTLRDLRNQIHLITEGENDALFETTQIKDIAETLKNAQTHFTLWADAKKNPNRTVKDLIERLDSSFFKLLDEMTIARSRNHIKSFYNVTDIGKFPHRLKPNSVYPNIDTKDRFFTFDELNKKISEYKLSVFNPSAYVLDEHKAKYRELAGTQVLAFTQEQREYFLIGMMKVNFLKRLESSIESFEISLDRTIKKIEKLEEKIKHFQQSNLKSQEETLESLEPELDELEEDSEEDEQWQVGKKLKFDLADLDLEKWLTDLSNDKKALGDLLDKAEVISPERDAKLQELKKLIQQKINKPLNEGNKKVIVFTAFADTAQYLYQCLKDWVKNGLGLDIALVAGSDTKTTLGKNDFNSILTNFSPISKNRAKISSMPQTSEIDILIATDCISEGQNLQDCDYLVNYDIHWNPVRIIQRFGRIDRLGSKNTQIQLVNFWATEDLDNYINLKTRVEARMALVDVTATGEDNLLNTEQIEDLIADDLKYRNKQLKRLKEEVLDLEDMTESVSLTDFTLDDFRIDLLNFLENNRKQLEEAPFGLYALSPSPEGQYAHLLNNQDFSESEKRIIQSGVIYCLRYSGNENLSNINPLQPYFLVYVREDGTIRYRYTNTKHILEILRLLCQGKQSPYEELCSWFDQKTEQGKKMDVYNQLIHKATKDIEQFLTKKVIQNLQTSRNPTLVNTTQMEENSDFELVTWLIIK